MDIYKGWMIFVTEEFRSAFGLWLNSVQKYRNSFTTKLQRLGSEKFGKIHRYAFFFFVLRFVAQQQIVKFVKFRLKRVLCPFNFSEIRLSFPLGIVSI